MFSRSDKSDELGDELFDDEPKQARSPMVIAAVAGLLAIAGAFLLVRYLSDNSAEVADGGVDAPKQTVLVVTAPIEAGTDVQELLNSPGSYLMARGVDIEYVAPGAITSIPELAELAEASGRLVLEDRALVGEQLLMGNFVDRADFDNDAFLERAAAVPAPEGHHTVVLDLPAERALGGNIRPGDEVAVVSAFNVRPPEGQSYEISIVVLPVVEVINVETNAEFIGELSEDSDSVGTSTLGNFRVSLAVEPWELTDLTYTIEFGEILLAVALPDAAPDDPRPFSTIDTIISGAEFNDDDLALLLGLLEEERGENADEGDDDTTSADGDAGAETDDPDPDADDPDEAEGGAAADPDDEGEAADEGGVSGSAELPTDGSSSGSAEPSEGDEASEATGGSASDAPGN